MLELKKLREITLAISMTAMNRMLNTRIRSSTHVSTASIFSSPFNSSFFNG